MKSLLRSMVSLRWLNEKIFTMVLICVGGILIGGKSYAQEFSITKVGAPGPVLVLSNSNTSPCVGLTSFTVFTSDIPQGTLIVPKQLLEIQWRTTYYPDSVSQRVQFCYYRPYSSQENCVDIGSGSSGTIYDFNNQSFDHGARVTIKHYVLGGVPPYTRPAGADSVTFRYRY